ncbi:hypothetical protein ACWFRF_15475 [Nocardia sp. NPDC055165]
MFDTHKNLAVATIVTPPDDALAGTDFVLYDGQGEYFAPNMPVTLVPFGVVPQHGNAEIAYVTAVNGDTVTVNRGQETPAKAVEAGWMMIGSITAKTLEDIETYIPTYTSAQIEALFRNSDITVTVGSSGDYATVKAAIAALSRLKGTYTDNGFAATINLLSGFTMAEQVFVRSLDLSWITITSEDAEVPVNPTFISAELIDEDNLTPIFGGIDNADLPIMDVLFAYPDRGDGYAASPKDGIVIAFKSRVLFRPGAGVKRARNGLRALYGSDPTCYMPGLTQGGGGSGAGLVTGVNFSYATVRAVMLSFHSTAGLARSKLDHCLGDYGIYAIWRSDGDFYQSQVNDTINGTAAVARDASILNMRESQVARSRRGYHALHVGTIDARSHNSLADPAAMWIGDSAKDCIEYGVLAAYGGHIDATEVNVSGSGIGVHASETSTITFSDGSLADNCLTIGVSATGAAIVNAHGASATGCPIGFSSTEGSMINAYASTAVGSTVGYSVDKGGRIVVGALVGSNTTNQAINLITGKGWISDAALPMVAKWSPANGAGAFQVTRADGTTNVVYIDTSSSTPKMLIGQGSNPGSVLNVNGGTYLGGSAGAATSHVDFAPSTTSKASARWRSGDDPVSPNDGESWYNSDLKFRKGSTTEVVAFKSYVDQAWKVVSGVGVAVTGSVLETVLATLTIPANALGPNGVIRLTLNFSHNNNGNAKTIRARFGGAAGTAFLSAAAASQLRTHVVVMIYNQNATNAQIGGSNPGNTSGYGQSTSAQVTAAIDTTSAQTLVISGELANSGDNIELKSYLLEYHYQA